MELVVQMFQDRSLARGFFINFNMEQDLIAETDEKT